MKSKRSYTWIVLGWSLAIAIPLVFGGYIIQQKQEQLNQAPVYGERPVPVETATARHGEYVRSLDFLSVVEAIETVQISPQLTATIERIYFEEGDNIKHGDVLVQLDAREIESTVESLTSQVEQVRAELQAQKEITNSLNHTTKYWQKELNRYQRLVEEDNISQQKVDETEEKAKTVQSEYESSLHKEKALQHNIDSLLNKRKELNTRLSYSTLKSPFSGIVTERLCDEGDLAQPGKTLLRVKNPSRMRLAFDVPQQDVPKIQQGLDVKFKLDGQEHSTQITNLFPAFNEARMIRAEAVVSITQSEQLQSGEYLPVTVIIEKVSNVVLVPNRSVIDRGDDSSYVFLLEGDRLQSKPIKIIGYTDDQVAVTGVEPETRVVLSTFLGWSTLSSGLKVEAFQ